MPDANAVIRAYAALVDEHHADLTALDQRSGDGDFGDNLAAGLAMTLRRVDAGPGDSAFAVAAEVFLDHVGGTSGPLFGLLCQSIAGAETMAAGMSAGLAAIQRVGEAEPGDRTMVDALAPAAAALSRGAALREVAQAAVDGAVATAAMRARMGRASYVGDRALGAPDPGAVGIALLFIALADAPDLLGELLPPAS